MVLPLNLNFLMAVCVPFMVISPCLTSNSLLSQSHLNQTKKLLFFSFMDFASPELLSSISSTSCWRVDSGVLFFIVSITIYKFAILFITFFKIISNCNKENKSPHTLNFVRYIEMLDSLVNIIPRSNTFWNTSPVLLLTKKGKWYQLWN